MKMKQLLAIGIIFLFIGVAVVPSINSTVVKTSNDNDLIQVTSQACGIQGFGNTTVKLTKQQYQNLEQYLVDFKARLNQTTTREEAVPLFKDAVVELNKFGLLPKGMSVQKAVDLTTGNHIVNNNLRIPRSLMAANENFFCLIAGRGSPSYDFLFLDLMSSVIQNLFSHNLGLILFYIFVLLRLATFPFTISIFPPKLNMALYYGEVDFGYDQGYKYLPIKGWVWTNGQNGVKEWDGEYWGNIWLYAPFSLPGGWTLLSLGATNFIGLRVLDFYFGAATWVKLSYNYPWPT
jgi:hypothetical protein